MRRAATAAFLLCPGLSACAGVQSALSPDGFESRNFLTLFTIFLGVCAVMYAVIMAALGVAIWRERRGGGLTVETGQHHDSAPVLKTLLAGWGVLILIGLSALTIGSFFTDRSNATIARHPGLTLNINANQWWWDVQYTTHDASKMIRTANEIHLPVGVPAEVTLQSNDVIHSLWIPNLAGKQDLIPGRVNDIQLLPTRIGVYRGQCAEFCGTEHTNMALNVVVESKADFQRWLAWQQLPAAPPKTPLQVAGYNYFVSGPCSSCHNINGTPAGGQVAPDLTHFASRRTIAAGTLPMTTGNIYGWVGDPQSQKPGSRMPTIGLSPDQLHAVVAYLETLK